jgi:hypothetical protein
MPNKPHAPPKESTDSDIELRPDGWERFEKAVEAGLKSGPKHRPSKSVVVKKRKD